MNAYLSSTTFLGTPANLWGTAPTASGEWGSGGALALGVATVALIALCVAARALAFCVERRRERRRKETRARKRREAEARAAVRADFWKNNGNSVNYATANDWGDSEDFVGYDDFGFVVCAQTRDGAAARGERRNNRRDRRGGKEFCAKRRFAAFRVAAFWTVVALGTSSVLPTLRPTDAPMENAPDEARDVERRWNETSVAFRAVADSEGSRWEAATLSQNAEDAPIKQNKTSISVEETTGIGEDAQDGKSGGYSENIESGKSGKEKGNAQNGKNRTVLSNSATAGDVAGETRLIAERRAVDESVAAPKARWVQTADGKLTQVAEIRAESRIEVPGDAFGSSVPEPARGLGATATRTLNVAERATNGVWRQRSTERAPQNNLVPQNGTVPQNGAIPQNGAATQSGQVAAFAQAPRRLPTARSERISQFEQTAQDLASQNAASARLERNPRGTRSSWNEETTQVAQAERIGGVGGIARDGANKQNGQNGQNEQYGASRQDAQYAEKTGRWQDASSRAAVVSSVYDATRVLKGRNSVTQEFAPSAPLIPYPIEERRVSISSVSYEPRPLDSLSLLEQIDAEFQRIGARVRKAVLSIETAKRATKTKSSKSAVETGCGFLFQYDDKIYLATNMHVVKGATSNKNVKIFLPDRTAIHPTKILTCADFDLAALELDPATLPKDGSVALCYFGNSDELQVSNFVGTIGNPFGLRDTVTYGHVSSLQRRKNDFTTDGEKSLLEFIQIDASINPGNSGGPLYNARGEVVGVVAAIATTTGKSEGVAFAIPINLALNVLKSTIDAGGWSRSRMGVELEAATSADFQGVVGWPIKSGSRIVNVGANSPAERAGLRGGDVVVEFEGEAIEDDVHFARLIAIADVSRTSNVKFLRDGELRETTARLERSGAE